MLDVNNYYPLARRLVLYIKQCGLVMVFAGLSVVGCDNGNGQNDAAAGGATCGTNTMLSTDGTKCQVASTACGAGTTFDSTTSTCGIGRNRGTMIWQSPLAQQWSAFGAQMATGDGGTTIVPVGDNAKLAAGFPDTTKLFAPMSGDPVGGNPLPAIFYTGNTGPVPNALLNQLTIADMKTCMGNLQIFKNPPSGKHTYDMYVTLTGCPSDLLFSVWLLYSPDDKYEDQTQGTPAGGLPNVFLTNHDGTGIFERELDPNIWFKYGNAVTGPNHSGGAGGIPAAPCTGCTIDMNLLIHNGGQSNGTATSMASFCVQDASNKCVTPAALTPLLPGQLYVDSLPWLTANHTTAGTNVANPPPLAMLQPY